MAADDPGPAPARGKPSNFKLAGAPGERDSGDAALPDLQAFLSADCPKRASFSVCDRCKARFEFAPPPT
jgi:hypothetical protein